jgi:hypothetical protein
LILPLFIQTDPAYLQLPLKPPPLFLEELQLPRVLVGQIPLLIVANLPVKSAHTFGRLSDSVAWLRPSLL